MRRILTSIPVEGIWGYGTANLPSCDDVQVNGLILKPMKRSDEKRWNKGADIGRYWRKWINIEIMIHCIFWSQLPMVALSDSNTSGLYMSSLQYVLYIHSVQYFLYLLCCWKIHRWILTNLSAMKLIYNLIRTWAIFFPSECGCGETPVKEAEERRRYNHAVHTVKFRTVRHGDLRTVADGPLDEILSESIMRKCTLEAGFWKTIRV